MKLPDQIRPGYFYDRRASVLSDRIAQLLPENGRVLDIGSGDGFICKRIQKKRPDIEIEGIDVLLRPEVHIPVKQFDGKHLPYAGASFDAVMFIDVLHHTDDPVGLIREAARVSRSLLILKDHTQDGFLAKPTLLYLDWVGNVRHGVSIPGNYWPEKRWRNTFAQLNLTVNDWTADIPLFPWYGSWLFGRSLHFIASLTKG